MEPVDPKLASLSVVTALPSSEPASLATRARATTSEINKRRAPLPAFLKWAGGKRWLVESHLHLFDGQFDRYIEPFLGGGSVFFALRAEHALLNDLNTELITAYLGIRQHPYGVTRHLHAHNRKHSQAHFYDVRSKVPRTLAAQAARTIYLNRTCFNGLYRVNQQGGFNVPIGDRQLILREGEDLREYARCLQKTELTNQDFETILDRAVEGDLVFIDPPYTVAHNLNGFRRYNERLFSWADQERLAAATARAARRGASIVATNASHSDVRELYSSSVFNLDFVSRFSSISGRGAARCHYDELLIVGKPRGN